MMIDLKLKHGARQGESKGTRGDRLPGITRQRERASEEGRKRWKKGGRGGRDGLTEEVGMRVGERVGGREGEGSRCCMIIRYTHLSVIGLGESRVQ